MDPYLEARHIWRTFHTRLLTYVSNDLQRQVGPRYAVLPEERITIGPVDQDRWPDVNVRETGAEPQGGVAVAARPAVVDETVPQEIEVPELLLPHRYLTVRDAANYAVVTVIEILSPWNKTGEGRDEYREKQQELLLSEANLVEIDLLRSGQHAVAVPASKVGNSDYRICIHRTGATRFGLIRFGVRDPLPTFRIPLRYDEPGALLHLGATVADCYEDGPYAYILDYSRPADPPVSTQDAAWAAERIAQWQSSRG